MRDEAHTPRVKVKTNGTKHVVDKPEIVAQKSHRSKPGSGSQDECSFRGTWPLGDAHSTSPTLSLKCYPQGEILVKD